MASFIKINNEYREIQAVYKKVEGTWSVVSGSVLPFENTAYFYSIRSIDDAINLVILNESQYVGKSFILIAKYGERMVYPSWAITAGSQYATVDGNGKVNIISGAQNNSITVQATYVNSLGITLTETKTINVTYDNELAIEGPVTMTGISGNVIARYNGTIVTPTWTITSGNSYGTIAADGTITILNSGIIIVSATYSGYTTTKTIELVYEANTVTETEINPDTGSTTTTTTTTTENQDGSTTTSSTTVVTNPDGSGSETTSTTTELEDGSSTTVSNTVNSDGSTTDTTEHVHVDGSSTTTSTTNNADGTSQQSDTNINTDGSSTNTTTNYNAEGDPVSGSNNETDSSGNSSTQTVIYDPEEGGTTVTGYTIDTSGNEDGEKPFNESGVNTEYYAFDVTHGFILDFNFTIDFAHQPANQNENHHNILTMKRAAPSPWYGFQLRQTGTTKSIIIGTQFSSGSNINTTIQPQILTGNVGEYNLKIIYDPTASTNKFQCINADTDAVIYSKNDVFPDIPELKYLKVTIGYAMDENGNPYRYSNINVKNFSIQRIIHVAAPTITCDGKHITLTSDPMEAAIYYRLNNTGSFQRYTLPITISANTFIEAYSTLNNEQSATVSQTCEYDNGIEEPIITCVENEVTITCATEDTTIYYKLGENGVFTQYTFPIVIYEDTIVYAYAELNNENSEIVSQTCLYDSGIVDPNIFCDGELITIDCDTPSVTIYYRLDNTGNFQIYEDAIEISADTFIEAYAELNGAVSHTVSKNCTYAPIVMVNPTIICNGSEVTISCATLGATIYYRLDNGNWQIYSSPISILQNTTVDAYATLSGHVSGVTTETCVYNPVHDYASDYLTLKALTAGTILWKSIGSGMAKTIEYSINNGAWTSITATSAGEPITVATNDEVRLRGTNTTYAKDKSNYSGFEGGTATYDIEGNIMSLIYGDNFVGNNTLTGTYNFCSMFKLSNSVSAENMILPATTLTNYCYRAIFSKATLSTPPVLPATTLAQGVYWYAFEECPITTAPDLLAPTLVRECYGYMFTGCTSLNYIKCLATSGFGTYQCLQGWVTSVARNGTFVKDVDAPVASGYWVTGNSGIPTTWLVYDNQAVAAPDINYDGFNIITLTCSTTGADIYYKLNQAGNYVQYSMPITISADTFVETYAEYGGQQSRVVSRTCMYISDVPIEASNRDLTEWNYGGQTVNTPYSVNAIDGHSASYAKGTFTFTTNFALRQAQPTHLWFQHADQSATIYIDDVQVEKHWGGYTAFAVDISNFVHSGQNNLKVALKNNEGNNLAPASGDFNFNATLGNVKLLTSPVLPGMEYGYDGFHVSSTVSDASATICVKTTVPSGASVTCTIDDGTYHWTDTIVSDGEEMTFTDVIANPHLWNGTLDPHLYDITVDIYYNNELYHSFTRGYGLRYYEYVINDTVKVGTVQNPYTGFLLNGSAYLLRGCCMHDDIDGKANALTDADYNQTFSIIQELGCNFLRLAHYPHPKEVYDRCDQLGIIVQTEGPCVNKMQSTMPTQYYEHLTIQYTDMVNQHYNHPCILFWGLSNETTTDDKEFAKTKIEGYKTLIKGLDPERWVGYVLAQGTGVNPSSYYNNPNMDWFGCNIYVGWYASPTSNNPSTELNKRIANTVTALGKPMGYSEYGCGGTQHCHSDDPQNTTTRGNNERHDIEYMMWLHEGQIAAIKNYPQLLFTSEWQLFDIAVSNRNEGYTVCLDGVNATTDDNLRRLNNKGLVERDHRTKKDVFYLYKAWWNPTPFIHICGKDYTKTAERVIKCYTNGTGTFTLSINGTPATTASPTDNILTFTAQNFTSGDVVTVSNGSITDSFTFES
jgi:hypothetical protein